MLAKGKNATIILVVAGIILAVLIISFLFAGSQDAQYRGALGTSTVPGIITLTASGPTGTPGLIASPQATATP